MEEKKQEDNPKKTCPWCGAKLRIRYNCNRRQYKAFWACTKYPKCKFTESFSEYEGDIK